MIFEFVFRLADGSKYIMHCVPEKFVDHVWKHIDEYCNMLGQEVVSVFQKRVED